MWLFISPINNLKLFLDFSTPEYNLKNLVFFNYFFKQNKSVILRSAIGKWVYFNLG